MSNIGVVVEHRRAHRAGIEQVADFNRARFDNAVKRGGDADFLEREAGPGHRGPGGFKRSLVLGHGNIGLQVPALQVKSGFVFELRLFAPAQRFVKIGLAIVHGDFAERISRLHPGSPGHRIADDTARLFSAHFNMAKGFGAAADANRSGVDLGRNPHGAHERHIGGGPCRRVTGQHQNRRRAGLGSGPCCGDFILINTFCATGNEQPDAKRKQQQSRNDLLFLHANLVLPGGLALGARLSTLDLVPQRRRPAMASATIQTTLPEGVKLPANWKKSLKAVKAKCNRLASTPLTPEFRELLRIVTLERLIILREASTFRQSALSTDA